MGIDRCGQRRPVGPRRRRDARLLLGEEVHRLPRSAQLPPPKDMMASTASDRAWATACCTSGAGTCDVTEPNASTLATSPWPAPPSRRPRSRAARRNHDHGGRGNDALRPQAQGRAVVAFRFGWRRRPSAVKMRKTLDLLLAYRRPGSKWTVKCTATWRSTASSARSSCRTARARERRQSVGFSEHRCSQYFLQPAQDRGRRNIAIGPVLLGAAKPVHILTASATVRRIVNMTALTVADANAER